MPFSERERTDVRRYCGFPAHGAGASGFQGWRFYQVYGLLEHRLNFLTGSEEAVVRQYLITLAQLEAAIPIAAGNLDTEQAAVWKRNANELRERTRLFDDWRRRLCGFLGIPPGPALGEGGLVLVV
ncbi:hypothetical protein [Limobrevibacterium gyesilva]|uniref:Uncharacterized protein n=1 Tax=Limobrevibacterium gyesilva TaxID=2991712 RepID=A0AA41YPE9_9PROT|nr:hypothetical protein [Limobrevibacterium gyesilva]MCW3477659.1 hypothetical protein [Limobrevibacterium gyesilva]